MEILDHERAMKAEPIVDKAGNVIEERTVIRFQKGVDFETFDDFREIFCRFTKSVNCQTARDKSKN